MDIERFITREDFLTIKPYSEGGTLIDGRRYATIGGTGLSSQNQLKNLGKVDKTGEGTIDKVFFFEVVNDTERESWKQDRPDHVIDLHIVSAKVVDRYRYVSAQEADKEVALIKAKIALKDK